MDGIQEGGGIRPTNYGGWGHQRSDDELVLGAGQPPKVILSTTAIVKKVRTAGLEPATSCNLPGALPTELRPHKTDGWVVQDLT